MKKRVIEEKPVIFNQNAEEAMEKLNKVLKKYKSYEPRYWIEAIAFLFYLKEYMYPSYSNEEVIAELEMRKKETLNNHDENLRAMNALEEIFAV